MQLHRAFTNKHDVRVNVLYTPVKLSLPYDPDKDSGKTPPMLKQCNAIWDTGATRSVITKQFAKEIGLVATGKEKVINTSGEELRNTYMVNVYLPSGVNISYLKVTECDSVLSNSDMLIGMDVIGIGDFAVTHKGGKTVMSYVYPSIKTIDFVKMSNQVNVMVNKKNKIEAEAKKRKTKKFTKPIKKKHKKKKK